MKVVWKFVFGDNHMNVDCENAIEDQKIETALHYEEEWLNVSVNGQDVYINLKQCKVIAREEINEEEGQSNTEPTEKAE
jgi:hypothetical protein